MVLGIYGAGGLGREVYELALRINNNSKRWSEIIFIDDSLDVKNLRKLSLYKFSDLQKKFSIKELEVCIAVGEPKVRTILFKKIESLGFKIATLIDPTVTIPKSTKIGTGTIICKFVSITCDILIEENVYIHPMACIGHDSVIGNSSIISSFVDVAGNCNIGNETFLAIGSILKQGISIGEKSILGMGSIVHNDIPSHIIAMGNPARPMKKNINQKVFKD